MHVGWVIEGIVLVVLGSLVALVCNAGRRSERFLSFAVSDQNRFRRGIKARPVDPARYKRGIKAGLAFAIVWACSSLCWEW